MSVENWVAKFFSSAGTDAGTINTELVTNGKDLGWLYGVLAGAGDSAIDVIAAAGVTVNNSTVPVDLLSVSVAANTRYSVQGYVHVMDNSADNLTDVKLEFDAPTGSTLWVDVLAGGTGQSSNSTAVRIDVDKFTTFPQEVARGSLGGDRMVYRFEGELSVGSTAGAFTIGGAQNSADATDLVFEVGRLVVQAVS